jgi:hypothetical protein
MSSIRCPSCQRDLHLPDSLRGARVKCPACGTPFPADGVGEPAAGATVAQAAPAGYGLAPAPAPPRRPLPAGHPRADEDTSRVVLPFRQRAAVCALGVAAGVLLLFLAPLRPRYRAGLTVTGVVSALASLVLLFPVWTVPREHPCRRDPPEQARRRRRLRRAGRSWLGMSRGFLRVLGVLGAAWLVLAVAAMFFPVTDPVSLAALGFGVRLFFAGWVWLAAVGTRDGIPWWWFLPRFRGRRWHAVMQYVRDCPERAANPFYLMMFGAVLVLATFALFLLYETVGNALAPARRGAAPAGRPLFADGPRVYLADLQEFDVKNGPWPFTKGGHVGDGVHPVQVNGVVTPKSLGMHPPDAPGHAAAKYHLGREAAVFRAGVALNDTAREMRSAAVFEVLGDGQLLWRSEPVAKPGGPPQECEVDVSGVDVLELRVRARGSYWGLHAVWLGPRLLRRADTPDR